MRILICNERFLFRYGVDRVLLILGSFWKNMGHEVIMMGNRLDPLAVNKCSDRFIYIPEAADYLQGNEFTQAYLNEHWEEWFTEDNRPDIAFVAGWPFYSSIKQLKEKCGYAIFHDYGAVPIEGMNEPQTITQKKLRQLRKENLRFADSVIAISEFLEKSQSSKDVDDLIPTSFIHLGVDHLDMNLWTSSTVNTETLDIIANIKEFKRQGYKILFQPGRWERGNYKNSVSSYEIVRLIKDKGYKIKILVLSDLAGIGEIPVDLIDNYFCMGFIDDITMRKAMEECDLGFSPTLWEGFDLPLGEMQYLNKHMYVFDVGAHPEVVAHSYFLCQSNKDMAEKICSELSGNLPIDSAEIESSLSEFRNKFTWKNCADSLLREFDKLMVREGVIFIDVSNACHDTANSGVMRVTRKVAHHLQQVANVVFVLWDKGIGEYVFPYSQELRLLCAYGGPDERKIQFLSKDEIGRKTINEVLNIFKKQKRFLLFTETINYIDMQQIIGYSHEKNINIAAIFYDAIPVLRPDLCSVAVAANHEKYMIELSECDLVLPIAKHNEDNLKEYWKKRGIEKWPIVTTIPLAGEMDNISRITSKTDTSDKEKKDILFVSTLEPRKNHIRFLKAFAQLMEHYPELRKRVSLTLVGNRYAGNDDIPKYVNEFCEKYPNTKWLGVVDDDKLKNLYIECDFTVYPSEIEGFGMPIVESLWFGKPCLCNEAGSIGELGSLGGCCLVDVHDINSIENGLYALLFDGTYFSNLQNEAMRREIVTWDTYKKGILDAIEELALHNKKHIKHYLSQEIKVQLKEYFRNAQERVILCSNYYPPNFLGGAEIIAHNQARSLIYDAGIPVVVVSLDISQQKKDGSCYMDEYEGVIVIRICVPPAVFEQSGINFFNEDVNRVFEELCEIITPTVMHGHNIIGMSLGIIDIAKEYGAKVCLTLHDHWGYCYKNTILDENNYICDHVLHCDRCLPMLNSGGIQIPITMRKSYFNMILDEVDAFISPSKYLAQSYIRAGFNYHKMFVVWNGIETGRYGKCITSKSDKLRITFAGYFGKHKGIDILIKAVAKLDNRNIEIELVGDGAEKENYKALARELGIAQRLRFLGKITNDEMEKVYAETDIYCLPSIWPENQPVSITEAMASGIPVIASDIGGNKELIQDGVTGYLFTPGNVEELAEKISDIAANRSRGKKMGEAAKYFIENYSYKKQISKIIDIYRQPTVERVRKEKVIAIKGRTIPTYITQIINKRILLLDWIIQNKDYSTIAVCIILEREQLTEEQEKLIKQNKILVLVAHQDYTYYKEKGWVVKYYKDAVDLTKKLGAYSN